MVVAVVPNINEPARVFAAFRWSRVRKFGFPLKQGLQFGIRQSQAIGKMQELEKSDFLAPVDGHLRPAQKPTVQDLQPRAACAGPSQRGSRPRLCQLGTDVGTLNPGLAPS